MKLWNRSTAGNKVTNCPATVFSQFVLARIIWSRVSWLPSEAVAKSLSRWQLSRNALVAATVNLHHIKWRHSIHTYKVSCSNWTQGPSSLYNKCNIISSLQSTQLQDLICNVAPRVNDDFFFIFTEKKTILFKFINTLVALWQLIPRYFTVQKLKFQPFVDPKKFSLHKLHYESTINPIRDFHNIFIEKWQF